MRASILTVGTEITSGQIIDRNSQWLSRELEALDIEVILHLTVPDDHGLILESLALCEQKSDWTFVCGGLGPTVDDFTREVVAKFVGQPLKMDEPSLQIIENKILRRGLTLREGHKQQALLPQGAVALENSYGVAPGFLFERSQKTICVLPGPPLEIAAIWKDHVFSRLEKLPRKAPHLKLSTWLCLGIAESELAHLCEKTLKPYSYEKQYGYRIELPYVEFKLWYDPTAPEVQESFTKLQEVLKPVFRGHSTTEIRAPFVSFLKNYHEWRIEDLSTQGALWERLNTILPEEMKTSLKRRYSLNPVTLGEPALEPGVLFLRLQENSTEKWTEALFQDVQGSWKIRVPWMPARTLSFNRIYAMEALWSMASSRASITS